MKYNNNVIGSKGRTSINQIEEIEKKYHFSFPDDMRKHYVEYNGGRLEKSLWVDKQGREYIFNYFIPIESNDGINLDKMLKLLDDESKPSWLIPFADDPGGNLFCFSVKKGEEGAIYFYMHDVGEGRDNVVFLSKTLTEFLNNLIKFEY